MENAGNKDNKNAVIQNKSINFNDPSLYTIVASILNQCQAILYTSIIPHSNSQTTYYTRVGD